MLKNKKKRKIVRKTIKHPLAQEYFKKQKKLTKKTLKKIVNSAKKEVDDALK